MLLWAITPPLNDCCQYARGLRTFIYTVACHFLLSTITCVAHRDRRFVCVAMSNLPVWPLSSTQLHALLRTEMGSCEPFLFRFYSLTRSRGRDQQQRSINCLRSLPPFRYLGVNRGHPRYGPSREPPHCGHLKPLNWRVESIAPCGVSLPRRVQFGRTDSQAEQTQRRISSLRGDGTCHHHASLPRVHNANHSGSSSHSRKCDGVVFREPRARLQARADRNWRW